MVCLKLEKSSNLHFQTLAC